MFAFIYYCLCQKSHHILEILGCGPFQTRPLYDSVWRSHVHVLRGRSPKMSLSESLKFLIWLSTYKARTGLILEPNFDTLITLITLRAKKILLDNDPLKVTFLTSLRVSTNSTHTHWGIAWPYNFFAIKFHTTGITFSFEFFHFFPICTKVAMWMWLETSVFFAGIFTQSSLYWRLIISRIIPGSRDMYKLVLERF